MVLKQQFLHIAGNLLIKTYTKLAMPSLRIDPKRPPHYTPPQVSTGHFVVHCPTTQSANNFFVKFLFFAIFDEQRVFLRSRP